MATVAPEGGRRRAREGGGGRGEREKRVGKREKKNGERQAVRGKGGELVRDEHEKACGCSNTFFSTLFVICL
jgi:hypothetical protein